MAFSMLRRASSSLAPLAVRAAGSLRSFRGAISTVPYVHDYRLHGRCFFPSSYNFSTAAVAKKSSSNESLLRVINSEINYVEENEDHDIVEIPDGFPFIIQDNPGERTVVLKRDYQGEIIKAVVDMPNPETNGLEDDDEEDTCECSIPLVVSITKGNGLCLKFGITAFPDEISIDNVSIKNPESFKLCLEFGITAFPDEISIDNVSIKNPESFEDQIAYEGPDFSDLDENLQAAFLNYLKVRGIDTRTTNIMLEYMINKDHKEYLVWLKNLKSFIKK